MSKARRFLALHPVFGTRTKPLPARHWQRSVYYWWWEYLRRNTDYKACCSDGGAGPLRDLYADFGDVSQGDFRSWWRERGEDLFAEAPLPQRLGRLASPAEWEAHWTRDTVLVVVVPLAMTRRKIKANFSRLLAAEHQGRPGRRSLKSTPSTAKRSLHGNFTINSLRLMLATYDACVAADQQPRELRPTRWQIGESLKLVPSAITRSSDTHYERTNKQNVMTAAVGRNYRKAQLLVRNAGRGRFPCMDP